MQFPSQCNPCSLFFIQSACSAEFLSSNCDMKTMLYQCGSCVSGIWLLVVLLTVLMYALPFSHGMLFYAKVSGIGILDQSEHLDGFLNSNVDSLCAIVSMKPVDLLDFRYFYGSKATMLVGFLLCTCGLFQRTRPPRYPHDHNQFSSDIEHLQDQEVLKCLIPKLKAL